MTRVCFYGVQWLFFLCVTCLIAVFSLVQPAFGFDEDDELKKSFSDVQKRVPKHQSLVHVPGTLSHSTHILLEGPITKSLLKLTCDTSPHLLYLQCRNCPSVAEYDCLGPVHPIVQAARVTFMPTRRGLKNYLKDFPCHPFRSSFSFLLPPSLKTFHLTYSGGTKATTAIIDLFLLLAIFKATYHPDSNDGSGSLKEIIFEGPGCFVLPSTLTEITNYIESKSWELEYKRYKLTTDRGETLMTPKLARLLKFGGVHVPSIIKFIGTKRFPWKKGFPLLKPSSVLELNIDAQSGRISKKVYDLKEK
ncbi:MAG: hypothetical protein JSR85_02115 [Proteobacteria bacterium]|nr:hypothetical protein [Pseudomonadota bacterium]